MLIFFLEREKSSESMCFICQFQCENKLLQLTQQSNETTPSEWLKISINFQPFIPPRNWGMQC